MQNLQIYKASAGSGKTHTLTQEYLKLAFEFSDKFSRILAVTFTNKAAEEMKVRILEEINEIIDKGTKSAHFQAIKNNFPNWDNKKIVLRAMDIRNKILHNYSDFSVSTMDSFVQKVIKSFSYEIGVQTGYQIEMDQDQVIKDLTEMLYQKIGTDKNLQNWLIKYASYKIDDGKNWDFRSEMANLTKEIFKERFQSFANTGLTKEEKEKTAKKNKENLLLLYDDVLKLRRDFESKMRDFGNNAIQILNNHKILETTIGRNFTILTNYLTKKIVFQKTSKDFEPGVTLLKMLDSVDSWTAKKTEAQLKAKAENIYPELSNILQDAVSEFQTNYSMYLSAKNTLANFHSFGILADIAEILPTYRDENNILLISDTTQMLKEIIADNDAPFIYEKIGHRFQHILIDEFQDTSGFQWENFKPLVLNSMSESLYNLIVGDVKQSIYRWRGGDWKLLLQQVAQDVGANQIAEKSLDTNWRSERNIVDFNNEFFRLAPKLLQNEINKEIETMTDEQERQILIDENYDKILTDAYQDSYQLLAPTKAKQGGRVKVHFIPKNKGESKNGWKENIADILPETINTLLKNKNYRAKDIAILVRKNSEGKQVVDMLLDYMNEAVGAISYDIISQDSLYIKNSHAVRIIINSLKYLYDERDSINLASLCYEYNKLTDNKTDHLDELFSVAEDDLLLDYLPEKFVQNKSELMKLSLFEMVEEIILIFGLHLKDETFPYIRRFEDSVMSYMTRKNSDLAGFLDWWDTKGKDTSIQLSNKQNALQVMTIHKSKGLAFNVVIIPFCDWTLESNSIFTSPTIWAAPNKAPFNKFDYLPLSYKKELVNTIYRKDYFDEKLYQNMDALNMLYVAFTRPKKELIIIAPRKTSDSFSSIDDLLYKTITKSTEIESADKKHISLSKEFISSAMIYENATAYKYTDKDKYKKQTSDENVFRVDDYPNHIWKDKLSIHYHSDDFFIKSIESVRDRVNYGTIMHQIMAQIKSKADLDSVLGEFYYSGQLSGIERDDLKIKVKEIMSRKSISYWFSDSWKVITEQALLMSNGEMRIPDRILVNEQKAIVIDYKFGEKMPDHKAQVQEYMRLVGDIENKPIEGFLYYAESDKVIRVKL